MRFFAEYGCYFVNMETEKSEDICQTRVLNNPSQIAKQVIHIVETSSDFSIVSLSEDCS